jgi:ABC-type polar amino acid transport system ATPase subunit
MNFPYWLNLRDHLLMAAADEAAEQGFLEAVGRFHHQVGVAGEEFPLLANFTVLENITVMRMYHKNESRRRAYEHVLPSAQALGMEEALNRRDGELGRTERLKAFVLRSAAKGNIIHLLDAPRISDVDTTLQAVQSLPKPLRLWVLCLAGDAPMYREFNLRRIDLGA